MKKLSLFASAIVVLAFTSCETQTDELIEPSGETAVVALESEKAAAGYTLIFEDTFDQGSDLSTNWNRTNRTDYNSDICDYKSGQNKIVKYGNSSCLRIEAKKSGNKYISGHIKSKKSFHPKWNEQIRIKGKILLQARQTRNKKDSRGRNIRRNGRLVKETVNRNFKDTKQGWPAFWTVNETSWPTKGEFDIMEGYSYGGSEHFSSNLFYGKETGKNDVGRTAEKEYKDFSGNGWHTYEMIWTNDKGNIKSQMKVDGKSINTYTDSGSTKWDFKKFSSHNLMINLNVGSNDGIFTGSPNLFDRLYMYVDYVRVETRKINVK